MPEDWWLRDALHAELDRRICHLQDWEVERLLMVAEMVRHEYAERLDELSMSTVALAVSITDFLVFGPDMADEYLAALRSDLAHRK